jgi:hypothetical protein
VDSYEITQIDLLLSNKDFLSELKTYLAKPIETSNLALLRAEIANAYPYMGHLIKVKAQAEAKYRMCQKVAASSANLKGTGRDAEINADTAHYRYARDLLEGCLDSLNSKLSASKAILSSLDNELKKFPGE